MCWKYLTDIRYKFLCLRISFFSFLIYQTRHYADIHLSSHVDELKKSIQNWAVILYFQPFATIKLERMSAAFGWTLKEVERHVVSLIQSGRIQGRVDSQNKVRYLSHHSSAKTDPPSQILQAKKSDYRAELFARTIKAGTEIQASNRKLLLRMKL